jgi:hypothetical protein
MDTKTEQKGTIKLSNQTKAELKAFGNMGETFEDVIKRLIFMVRNGKMSVEQSKQDKEIGRKL